MHRIKLNLVITYWIFEFQIAHPLVLRVDFHQLAENPACLFSNPISSPLLSPFWCLLHLQHFYPLRLPPLPPLPTQSNQIMENMEELRFFDFSDKISIQNFFLKTLWIEYETSYRLESRPNDHK